MKDRRFRLFGGRFFDKAFSSSRVWGQMLFLVLCCVAGVTVLYILGGVGNGAVDGFLKDTLRSVGVDGARLRRIVELMLDPGVFAGSNEVTMMPEIWQLVIALCGTVVFMALIINAFGNIVDNRVEAYKKGLVRYRFKNHVVFLGSNEIIIGMLDHLATVEKFRKKKFVVLTSADCESVRDNVTSHISTQARQLDITFLYGERNQEESLYSIYIDKASHIYIVGEDNEMERDSVSVESWNIIKAIRQKASETSDMVAKCYLVLDRQSSSWIFNKIPADPVSGIETNIIDSLESLSQRVLVNPMPDGDMPAPPTLDGTGIGYESDSVVHLVISGMTQMSSAMAMTAAHICHFPNYLRDKTKKTIITFIAPDAEKEMAFMTGRYSHLFRLSEYEYIHEGRDEDPVVASHHVPEKDFLDVRWQFVKGSVEQKWVRNYLLEQYAKHKAGQERLTLAFCGNDAENNIASALYLPEEFYAKETESKCEDVTILVYQPVSGERISTARMKTYRYSNVYPFGQHDRCYDPSYRARLLAAKKINYLYEKYDKYEKMPDRNSYSVLDQLWRGKSFMERASSMYSANTVYMKLRSVGLNAASTSEELKKHVDVLAEVEHNRWDIERLILGVSDMTASQRAQADADPGLYKNHWKTKLLMNKNIIPYDELDEGTKDYDRIIVGNMIDVVKG